MKPAQIGKRLAARAFDVRARGRGRRGSEIHLTEAELADLLALAAEKGAELVTGVDLAELVLSQNGKRT